jgi:hypothetical protein
MTKTMNSGAGARAKIVRVLNNNVTVFYQRLKSIFLTKLQTGKRLQEDGQNKPEILQVPPSGRWRSPYLPCLSGVLGMDMTLRTSALWECSQSCLTKGGSEYNYSPMKALPCLSGVLGTDMKITTVKFSPF